MRPPNVTRVPPISMQRPRLFAAASAAELVRLEWNFRRSPEAVRADQLVRLRAAIESARAAPFGTGTSNRCARCVTCPTSSASRRPTRRSCEKLRNRSVSSARCPRAVARWRRAAPAAKPSRCTTGRGRRGGRACCACARTVWHGLQPWHRTASLTLRHETARTEGIAGTVRRARGVHLPTDLDMDELARRVIDARPVAVSGHPHLLIELGNALHGRVGCPRGHDARRDAHPRNAARDPHAVRHRTVRQLRHRRVRLHRHAMPRRRPVPRQPRGGRDRVARRR